MGVWQKTPRIRKSTTSCNKNRQPRCLVSNTFNFASHYHRNTFLTTVNSGQTTGFRTNLTGQVSKRYDRAFCIRLQNVYYSPPPYAHAPAPPPAHPTPPTALPTHNSTHTNHSLFFSPSPPPPPAPPTLSLSALSFPLSHTHTPTSPTSPTPIAIPFCLRCLHDAILFLSAPPLPPPSRAHCPAVAIFLPLRISTPLFLKLHTGLAPYKAPPDVSYHCAVLFILPPSLPCHPFFAGGLSWSGEGGRGQRRNNDSQHYPPLNCTTTKT